jgi:hypothetical protein
MHPNLMLHVTQTQVPWWASHDDSLKCQREGFSTYWPEGIDLPDIKFQWTQNLTHNGVFHDNVNVETFICEPSCSWWGGVKNFFTCGGTRNLSLNEAIKSCISIEYSLKELSHKKGKHYLTIKVMWWDQIPLPPLEETKRKNLKN